MSIHIFHKYFHTVFIWRGLSFTLHLLVNSLPVLSFPDVWTSSQNVSHCPLISEDLYFWSPLNPDKENSPMYWLKFCPLKRFAFIPVLIGTVVLHPSVLVRHFHNVRTICMSDLKVFFLNYPIIGSSCEAISMEWERSYSQNRYCRNLSSLITQLVQHWIAVWTLSRLVSCKPLMSTTPHAQ